MHRRSQELSIIAITSSGSLVGLLTDGNADGLVTGSRDVIVLFVIVLEDCGTTSERGSYAQYKYG